MFNSCYVPAGENIKLVNESIKKKIFRFHFKNHPCILHCYIILLFI